MSIKYHQPFFHLESKKDLKGFIYGDKALNFDDQMTELLEILMSFE